VDALVENALKAWQAPGVAVAIVRNDEVIYLKGHGVKELDVNQPVTPDTVFPIASCTKAFTTTALAMLKDDGKLDWDDPVRKHVEFFHLADPLADANVTLRDLVTHRTGVASYELLWYRSPWTQEEIIRKIGLVKPQFPFRGRFHYQTTMFQAAGYAVGTVSRSSWDEFVSKRIFEPLEMKTATLTTPDALKLADHASPHRLNGQGKAQVIPWYVIQQPDPAGSVHASARDLANWLRLHLNGGVFQGKRLVSAESLDETHSPQTIIRLDGVARALNPNTLQMSYGMAWVIQDYRGHMQISHAGAIDGFRAHFTLLPQAKIGIVLLNNLHETRMNLALSNSLVDLLLGLPKKDWNGFHLKQVEKEAEAARARFDARLAQRHHGTKPSRELAAYVGTYEEPAYGTARIKLKDGVLVWQWSTFDARLEHFHYDTFTIQEDAIGKPQIVFTLGADGNVASMKVSEPLGVEFQRVRRK